MDSVIAALLIGLGIYCVADAPKVHNGGYCPPEKVECQQDKK